MHEKEWNEYLKELEEALKNEEIDEEDIEEIKVIQTKAKKIADKHLTDTMSFYFADYYYDIEEKDYIKKEHTSTLTVEEYMENMEFCLMDCAGGHDEDIIHWRRFLGDLEEYFPQKDK